MLGPDPYDDTGSDCEQFEKTQLAQDCDAAGTDTADVDDATAQNLISELIDAEVVTPVPEERDHIDCDGCGLVVDTLAASPAFHAGFQRDFRSRPAHAIPGRTGAS